MRNEIKEYEAVAKAAEKFVKSVAEGNSEYAKTLFTEDAVLFGMLNGNVVDCHYSWISHPVITTTLFRRKACVLPV